MQVMFRTILCALLIDLILTKATNTPKDYITSNIFQEESVSVCPDLNFTQNISMSEESDHHILNFKSDRSSDSTVRNKREVDEVTFADISITPKSIESSLSKPTSLRAFVQFDSQFTEKVNDIFVILRWNQPEFIDEIIQGYTVQCFLIEDLKEIQICDDKNITTSKLEQRVHNLTSNTTYYFRVRAHTKIVAGPYTDLINVSTTHENPIPISRDTVVSCAKSRVSNKTRRVSLRELDSWRYGDSPLLVLELMEIGDLLKYLRECRNLQASDSHALRLQDLFAMCEDVARVSSRNREDRIIKIGDFGLARDIYKDDYYCMDGEGLHPIRWMAPESLMIRKFTSQSDVWLFGVLMWEITSLGEQPYNAKANEEVINYVRAGGRLPMTLNCPSPLYQLMLNCWSVADARPNFKFCLKNIIALRKNIKDALLSPIDTI
ncbi:putative insulin-like peptide receptor [Camponotus floridanus]|uniref:putative insulin-like peptide receptor n=1 Tax=Camponotus floridanus TaxID=104421 RepID=UPI000DC6A9CB|nr:putative insulin-like peptide receptor [Camponotus floridanus]